MDKDKSIVTKYLVEHGIDKSILAFSAVSTNQNTKRIYSGGGDYMGEEFDGYTLSQSIKISSNEVGKVERISERNN